MAKKNENRKLVQFICKSCKRETYKISKNVKNTPTKLNLHKYCKFCQESTEHVEKK